MKKVSLGVLASLMVAGAISAASGLTTHPVAETIVMIGDGTSPILMMSASPAGNACEHSPQNK